MVYEPCFLCGRLTVHSVWDPELDVEHPMCRNCFEMDTRYTTPERCWLPDVLFPERVEIETKH
jgi:hypothetical protein